MNRALIGVQALLLASVCIGGPAQAVPAGPRAAIAAAQSVRLVPADYYRRNRYRHGADPAPVAADSAGIKPGQWEFTTRLEAFPTPPPPPGTPSPTQSPQATQPQSGGDATYLSCIQSDRAVPVEFGAQCKLDSPKRQGPRVTWSMICTNPQGAVRSDGVAQYHGDTMDATLVNHFPAANGTLTDLTQRITGRYLQPCPQVAAGPVIPPRPNAPPNASSGSSSQWVDPPAASGSTAPSAATAAPPSAAPPQDAASAAPAQPLPKVRYARQRRHLYHRYYGGGYGGGPWPGGGGLFGIRLPFLGGL